MKLLLFDIDGTLIDTGGAGMRSLTEAALELYGDEGPPLDLAGSTDEGIVRNLLTHFSVEITEDAILEFYSAYLRHLDIHLKSDAYPGVLLPGVSELLKNLQGEHHIALLTGNIAKGGMAKVSAYGIEHHFPFGAWGDDHWDRNKLGPIALERAEKHFNKSFNPEETWIIGDTPKDIACARAIGANVLAVATGRFKAHELTDADMVLNDLTNTTAARKVFA